MNDDKEAFEKWADRIEVEWGIDGHKVTLFSRLDMAEAWQAACEYKQSEIKKLQAENAKLRECVEFYADPNNYFLTTHQRPRVKSSQRVLTDKDLSDVESHILQVGGKRARQALKELEEK